MKVFDTEDKLKEFQINYEIKPKNNNYLILPPNGNLGEPVTNVKNCLL